MSVSLLVVFVALSISQPAREATSLLGVPLVSPAPSEEVRAKLEADLAAARTAVAQAPDNADARIWVGRRLAYLGRYREAIDVFSEGAARFPSDARFLRHRGHRYITVREFDRAVADLERARTLADGAPDQVEPDGQPNARNIPLTTLQSNIRYHLALAYYVKGDFEKAAVVWQQARDSVKNADNLVSTTHWLYLTLRRLGRTADATRALEAVGPGLEVIENGSYYSLCQLYRGERTATAVQESAGKGSSGAAVIYGVSAWHAINGRNAEAEALWRQLVSGGDWAPFGVIAAEADLARLKKPGTEVK